MHQPHHVLAAQGAEGEGLTVQVVQGEVGGFGAFYYFLLVLLEQLLLADAILEYLRDGSQRAVFDPFGQRGIEFVYRFPPDVLEYEQGQVIVRVLADIVGLQAVHLSPRGQVFVAIDFVRHYLLQGVHFLYIGVAGLLYRCIRGIQFTACHLPVLHAACHLDVFARQES